MFNASLNDVLSVCTCYETLPQGLAKKFIRKFYSHQLMHELV